MLNKGGGGGQQRRGREERRKPHHPLLPAEGAVAHPPQTSFPIRLLLSVFSCQPRFTAPSQSLSLFHSLSLLFYLLSLNIPPRPPPHPTGSLEQLGSEAVSLGRRSLKITPPKPTLVRPCTQTALLITSQHSRASEGQLFQMESCLIYVNDVFT